MMKKNNTSKHNKIKLSKDDKIFYIISYAVVTLLTLLVLYPVIYIVSTSFSSGNAVAQGKVWLYPVDFSLDGYKAATRQLPFPISSFR